MVAAAASIALLAGCGGGSSVPLDDSSGGGSSSGGSEGGIAVVSLSSDPGSLDPTIANTFPARVVFTSFCEKLYDADENLELVPQLAAELPKVSDDGLTVDIALREGVEFNDGTPFDADAVKISLDRHRELPTSARASELSAVDEVKVVDDTHVELTLSKPFAPLGAQLADRAGMIMSPAQLEEKGDDFGTDPVCAGPFAFDGQTAGSEVRFVKSDYYYDKDLVKLDGVTYEFVTDPTVRAANLQAGDVQVAERVNASDAERLANEDGIEVLDAATIAYQAMSFNVDPEKSDSPLATNPDLRKAFELSVDREALNSVVFQDANVVDCIGMPMQSSYRPDDVECTPFDPDQAKQILEESGESLPISVELMYPSTPAAQKTVEVIMQMADEVGFDVQAEPLEFLSALDRGRAGDFEAFLIGWSGRIDPDGNYNDIVTSGGSNNFSQLSDPDVDALVSDAAAAQDPADRKALYDELISTLADTRQSIYLYHDTWYLGLSGIEGVEYSSDAIPRLKTASLTE